LAPKGFRAAGIACGIKKDGSKDLALIVSEVPARVAGLFTQNRVKAAPVLYTRRRVRRGVARALLANSGCANACTGRKGMEDVRRSVETVSRTLGIPREDVLVASTGVIGEPLPVERIEEALPRLTQLLSPQGFKDAASAIMTTDTVPKLAERTLTVRGKEVSLLGMAKGAGMIRPRLATMLAFLFTDLEVPPPMLRELLLEGNSRSFARITVDGESSTNDTVLLFANGASGVSLGEEIGPFRDLLFEVMEELALGIVRAGDRPGCRGKDEGGEDHGQGGAYIKGRLKDRLQDRYLAAGEDRPLRPRPQLGEGHGRPGGRRGGGGPRSGPDQDKRPAGGERGDARPQVR